MPILPRRPRTLVATALLLSSIVLLAWWLWPRLGGTDSTVDPNADTALNGPRVRVSAIGKPEAAAKPVGLAFQRALGSVSGTITEPGGKPLPGASVCAWFEHRDAPRALTRTPRCTASGPDGHYRLADLPPIDVIVGASAAEHVPATWQETPRNSPIHLQPGQDRKGVDLELAPGGVPVQGIVRDIAGGVVEGALVTVSADGNSSGYGGRSLVITDAEGRFEAWTAEGDVFLDASAEGYGNAWRSGIAPGQTFELFMTPESILVGRVVHAGTREPVPNAVVSNSGREWSRADAITDAEGTFRIEGLSPGTYHPIVTTDEGYGSAPRPIHVGLAQTSDEVVIEIHPSATVSGVIVGAEDVPCVQGGVMLSSTMQSGPVHSGGTESDGSVRIRGVRPGTYTLAVNCEGHVRRTDFEPLVVERTPIADQRWVLTRGVTLTGTVVDSSGAPIVDARVSASSVQTDRTSRSHSSWGNTDASGRFTLEGLVAGKYKLNAGAEGYLWLTEPIEIEIGEQGAEGARIELERGSAIEGDVVDSNGKPVAGATVNTSGSQWGNRATARDDGTFRIEGVKPGNYRVSASRGWSEGLRAPGETDDAVKGVPIEVVANEVAKVHLVVEALDGRIAGRVVDASGAPVSDAFIGSVRESDSAATAAGSSVAQTRWGSWARKPVLTDENGDFELDELAAGLYTLRASRKGGGEAVIEHVAVGSTGVVLTITANGSITGRVVLAGGGVPESFTLSVNDSAKGYWQSHEFYETDGTFEMTEVPAGEFKITATSSEGDGTTDVTLASGETRADISIELAGKVDVRGRVVDLETGEPIAGLRIGIGAGMRGMMLGMGASDDDPSVSDESGRFLARGVAAGRAQLTITPRSWNDENYDWTSINTEIPADVRAHDLGDVQVPKRRRKRTDDRGDLGFKMKEVPPGVQPNEFPLTIAVVRPGGPAAVAGLEVGDVIETVDGHDVKGGNRYLYYKLVDASVGTKIVLDLAGGRRAEIVVGPAP